MPCALIDCHLHLQDPAYAGQAPAVIRRALDAGVGLMVCNGTSYRDWPDVAELCRHHSAIVPCFGLHPWFVSARSADWLQALEQYLMAAPSGVGEIGLDRWIKPRDEPAQEHAFRAQLDLARRLNRPAMVHCLRAWGWLMDVLRSEPPLPAGLLIHAYGGPAELIAPLTQMGAYFSFAGNILETRKPHRVESLLTVPRDRLLIETDAPDMLPPPPYCSHIASSTDGRQLNEPANLPAILHGIASLRHETEDQLRQALIDNALRFLTPILSSGNL